MRSFFMAVYSIVTPELAQTFGVAPGSGVIIVGVLQAGPAAQAGMQPGDVVRSVHGQPTRTETRHADIRVGPQDPALFRLPEGFRLIEPPPRPGR